MGDGKYFPSPILLLISNINNMVKFNELDIDAGGCINIDLQVKDCPWYSNVYLSSLKLYSQKSWEEQNPLWIGEDKASNPQQYISFADLSIQTQQDLISSINLRYSGITAWYSSFYFFEYSSAHWEEVDYTEWESDILELCQRYSISGVDHIPTAGTFGHLIDIYQNAYVAEIRQEEDQHLVNDIKDYYKYYLYSSQYPKQSSVQIYPSQLCYLPLDGGTKYTHLDAEKDVFVVEVECTGTPDPSTPCGKDNATSTCVLYSKDTIYKKSMGYLTSMEGCEPNRDFIDYMLKVKGLDLSAKACNYSKSFWYWNLLNKPNHSKQSSKCGCHGKS